MYQLKLLDIHTSDLIFRRLNLKLKKICSIQTRLLFTYPCPLIVCNKFDSLGVLLINWNVAFQPNITQKIIAIQEMKLHKSNDMNKFVMITHRNDPFTVHLYNIIVKTTWRKLKHLFFITLLTSYCFFYKLSGPYLFPNYFKIGSSNWFCFVRSNI